jgi:hypothetical protein
MKRILLYIEIGNWDGGNNGRYPKLIEFDLDNDETPFMESEGWGWGLGGASYSLERFVSVGALNRLNIPSSMWAYEIIKWGLDNKISLEEISNSLKVSYIENKADVPENFKVHLKNA